MTLVSIPAGVGGWGQPRTWTPTLRWELSFWSLVGQVCSGESAQAPSCPVCTHVGGAVWSVTASSWRPLGIGHPQVGVGPDINHSCVRATAGLLEESGALREGGGLRQGPLPSLSPSPIGPGGARHPRAPAKEPGPSPHPQIGIRNYSTTSSCQARASQVRSDYGTLFVVLVVIGALCVVIIVLGLLYNCWQRRLPKLKHVVSRPVRAGRAGGCPGGVPAGRPSEAVFSGWEGVAAVRRLCRGRHQPPSGAGGAGRGLWAAAPGGTPLEGVGGEKGVRCCPGVGALAAGWEAQGSSERVRAGEAADQGLASSGSAGSGPAKGRGGGAGFGALVQRPVPPQSHGEELRFVENGCHDNPTLDVASDSQSEMQEKQPSLNGGGAVNGPGGWSALMGGKRDPEDSDVFEEDTHL